MELNIYLAPPASWGLGHLLSGDLWPTYCGVTSSSNATCCVRYIWQEIRLYCTCWMEETCSSILIRLNSAKCMAILSLPHWFCVQMSTEHWAWDVPFSKALQMWWLIQPRSSWEITCEENSWPMRNSWWERERERANEHWFSHHSPSHPTVPRCSCSTWPAKKCPQLWFPRKLWASVLRHVVSAFLAALPHFLVSLTLATTNYTLSHRKTLISKLYLSLCSLEAWVLTNVCFKINLMWNYKNGGIQ